MSRTQPANMLSSETRSREPWASRRRCQGRQAGPSAVVADNQMVKAREQLGSGARRKACRIKLLFRMDAVGQVQDLATNQCGLSQGGPSSDQAMCAATGDQLRIRILGTFSRTHELLRTVAGRAGPEALLYKLLEDCWLLLVV